MKRIKLNAKSAAILVMLGAILSGLVGPFDRTLSEYGFNYFSVTFYRSIITVLVLAIVMIVIDKTLFKIKKEHILLFILLGICKGCMDMSFLHSQEEISLSLTTVLQMTAPYFLIVFGAIIFKDKITKKKVAAVLIGTVSACLVSNVFFDSGSITIFGVLLGLFSGITYAGYMMTSSVLVEKKYNILTLLFYAFLITVVMTIPSLPVANTVDIFINHPDAIWTILAVAVGCTLLPYAFDAIGVKYVDVTAVTVFSMLEIAVSAILGYFMYDEAMNVWMIIGMFLLLVSMLLINEKKQEHEEKTDPPKEEITAPPET